LDKPPIIINYHKKKQKKKTETKTKAKKKKKVRCKEKERDKSIRCGNAVNSELISTCISDPAAWIQLL